MRAADAATAAAAAADVLPLDFPCFQPTLRDEVRQAHYTMRDRVRQAASVDATSNHSVQSETV